MTTTNAVPAHQDSQSAVTRANGYGIRTERTPNGEPWRYGCVRTPDAVVIVYSEQRVTSLTVIRNGIEYARRFDRAYSARHLVTLATRFAQEVFHG